MPGTDPGPSGVTHRRAAPARGAGSQHGRVLPGEGCSGHGHPSCCVLTWWRAEDPWGPFIGTLTPSQGSHLVTSSPPRAFTPDPGAWGGDEECRGRHILCVAGTGLRTQAGGMAWLSRRDTSSLGHGARPGVSWEGLQWLGSRWWEGMVGSARLWIEAEVLPRGSEP